MEGSGRYTTHQIVQSIQWIQLLLKIVIKNPIGSIRLRTKSVMDLINLNRRNSWMKKKIKTKKKWINWKM